MPAGEFGKWKGGRRGGKKHLESRSDGCVRFEGKTAKGVGNRAIKGLTKKLERFSERENIIFFRENTAPDIAALLLTGKQVRGAPHPFAV